MGIQHHMTNLFRNFFAQSFGKFYFNFKSFKDLPIEITVEKLEKHSLQYHNRYYPGWKVFEKDAPPHGRNVSWEAFVKLNVLVQLRCSNEEVFL